MLTYSKKEIKDKFNNLIIFYFYENKIVHNISRNYYNSKEVLWSMKRLEKNGNLSGILIIKKND